MSNGKETSFQNRIYKTDTVSPAIQGNFRPFYEVYEMIGIKQNTEKGYEELIEGGVCDLTYPSSTTRRGRVQDNGNTCPTLPCEPTISVVETSARIRKLTPKECWRLMDFSDKDFASAESVNSNTQLYKQAGNSIVVSVLEGIFANLF